MPARRTSKSDQAPAAPKYYEVFVPERYVDRDGEDQTRFHRVGAAFPHRTGDGLNIEITRGISATGRLVAFPPLPREEKEDEKPAA